MNYKAYAQNLLDRVGVYHRVKASGLYELYWNLFDRSVLDKRHREVQFYKHLLGGLQQGDLIFDIGANKGSKTDVFLRLGARVVTVERDTRSQKILEERFLKWRLRKK